jgi:hypothetical protein
MGAPTWMIAGGGVGNTQPGWEPDFLSHLQALDGPVAPPALNLLQEVCDAMYVYHHSRCSPELPSPCRGLTALPQ